MKGDSNAIFVACPLKTGPHMQNKINKGEDWNTLPIFCLEIDLKCLNEIIMSTDMVIQKLALITMNYPRNVHNPFVIRFIMS